MIKNVLQDIGGIGAYGIASLCLFFAVFVGASLWALCQKSGFCKAMSSLPLQDEPNTTRFSRKEGEAHD